MVRMSQADPRGLAWRGPASSLSFPQETLLVGQGTLSCCLYLAQSLLKPVLRQQFTDWG